MFRRNTSVLYRVLIMAKGQVWVEDPDQVRLVLRRAQVACQAVGVAVPARRILAAIVREFNPEEAPGLMRRDSVKEAV